MHGDLAEQFGFFKLRLQQVLLVSHSRAILCVSGLRGLIEQFAIALKDRKRLRQIGQSEVCGFDVRQHLPTHGLVLLLRDSAILLRDLPLEAQFTWIREVLRRTKSDVRKVAVRVSGERTRAADAELLDLDLWVGQRRDFSGHLLCRDPRLVRCLNLRIVPLCFRKQVAQARGRLRVRRYNVHWIVRRYWRLPKYFGRLQQEKQERGNQTWGEGKLAGAQLTEWWEHVRALLQEI